MTQTHDAPTHPAFLTTREVADLLRVKERKVYDLAAAGDIPHRRVPGTGKLLFPKGEIDIWINGDGPGAGPLERPLVLTGSHDPLLDWALRESGTALATRLNGSFAGLDLFARGEAAATGLHIPDSAGWNRQTVAGRAPENAVLIGWAARARGLIIAPQLAEKVKEISDLRGRAVVLRQPGAGAAALFDSLLSEAGIDLSEIDPASELARTESDAAAAIAEGRADAALGIAAMAHQFRLPFVPLMQENFDLLIDRTAYFTEAFQQLVRFMQTPAFAAKAGAMTGYDLSETGTVRWNAP